MRPVKLSDQVPTAYSVGTVKIRCKCGTTHEIDAREYEADGLTCPCGQVFEGKGKDLVKKAGAKIMRRYSAGHDR